MSDEAPLQPVPVEIRTLEFYIDCEILRLLYQMKAGEDLDINVVDQNETVSEIHAVRKKTRIDREVSVLSIKGSDVLKFHSGGLVRCLLGEEVDSKWENLPKDFFPGSSYEYVYLGQESSPKLQGKVSTSQNQETQTELNYVNSMQKSLLEGQQKSRTCLDETGSGADQPSCDSRFVETSSLQLIPVTQNPPIAETEKRVLTTGSPSAPRKRKRGRPRKYEGSKDTVANILDAAIELHDPQCVDEADRTNQGFGEKSEVNLTKSGRRVKKPVLHGSYIGDFDAEDYFMKNDLVHAESEPLSKQRETGEKCDDAELAEKGERRINTKLEDEARRDDGTDQKARPKRGRRNRQQCPICGKIVNNMSSHIQVHDDPMKCNSCDKTFTQTHNLLRHIATMHQGKFPHTCDICGKGYTWNRSLLEHIESVHNNGKSDQKTFFPRIHQCEECGRAFKNSSALRGHIDAIHKKLKSFACELCPKKFAKRYHLNVHMRTHSGEKPYLCSFCGKGFADKGNMDVHVQSVHLRNLPHKCDVCNMEFRRKKFLTMHRERGHDDDGNPLPTRHQMTSIRKTTTARKVSKSTDSFQIVHFQMPDGSILHSPYDALQIAVEEIKDSAMEALEQEHLAKDSAMETLEQEPLAKDSVTETLEQEHLTVPIAIKTETSLAEHIQIPNAIATKAIQGVQQCEMPSDSLTLNTVQNLNADVDEELEATNGEVAQFRQLLANATVQLQPGEALPMDGSVKYVTKEVESIATNESVQQNFGQPQLSILKVEGDDQPYFLIQSQGGSITL